MINVTGIVDALPLGSTDSLVSNFFESCGAVVGQVPIIRRNTKGGLQPDHRTNWVRGLLPVCRLSRSGREFAPLCAVLRSMKQTRLSRTAWVRVEFLGSYRERVTRSANASALRSR